MTTSITQTITGKLEDAKATFADIYRILHQPEGEKTAPARVVPKAVVLSPAQLDALAKLPELVDAVAWPKTCTKLNATQRATLQALWPVLTVVEGITDAVRESGRTAVLNHGDLLLEETKGFDPETTARDKDGHYLVKREDDFVIDGVDTKLTRIPSEPGVSVSVEALEMNMVIELPEDGALPEDRLTRPEFLSVTSVVRVLDQKKLMKFLRKSPHRVAAVAKAARFGTGSVSVRVAKND